MARVGVSYPRYAVYTNNNGTVTYGGAKTMGKATTFSISLDGGSDNVLYADNAPAESANTFAGGTISIGVDDLYDTAAVDMLGLTDDDGEIVSKADATTPYLGVGGVVKHIRNGVAAYTGIILTKTQFTDPGITVNTQGETIEWQTPELSGTIMKDDTADGVWRRYKTFDTEAAAKSYVDTFFAAGA